MWYQFRAEPVPEGESAVYKKLHAELVQRRVPGFRFHRVPGPYYEKRIVHCGSQGASHVRMLGEGYNYGMMEQDPRNAAISQPINDEQAIGENTSILNVSIAEFTCETKDI